MSIRTSAFVTPVNTLVFLNTGFAPGTLDSARNVPKKPKAPFHAFSGAADARGADREASLGRFGAGRGVHFATSGFEREEHRALLDCYTVDHLEA